jgi:hypothetical protein
MSREKVMSTEASLRSAVWGGLFEHPPNETVRTQNESASNHRSSISLDRARAMGILKIGSEMSLPAVARDGAGVPTRALVGADIATFQ